MSAVPQLDWPKDLYATPWKDVDSSETEPPHGRLSNYRLHMSKRLACCIAAPCVMVMVLVLS